MTAQRLTIENPGINLKRTMIYDRIAESGSLLVPMGSQKSHLSMKEIEKRGFCGIDSTFTGRLNNVIKFFLQTNLRL